MAFGSSVELRSSHEEQCEKILVAWLASTKGISRNVAQSRNAAPGCRATALQASSFKSTGQFEDHPATLKFDRLEPVTAKMLS